MQSEIGVREFKNGVSRFIERVEAGEVLTVTRRGKAVARVIPAGMPPGISELIGARKARWSGRRPTVPKPIVLRGDGPLASDYVIAGRR
jgi:prevent-host-death family protein